MGALRKGRGGEGKPMAANKPGAVDSGALSGKGRVKGSS